MRTRKKARRNLEQIRLVRELESALSGSAHTVRPYGDAVLWLEDQRDQVTVAWVSTLPVRRFLQELMKVDNDDLAVLVSRRSPTDPEIDSYALRSPRLLTKAQEDGIYLVRAELPQAIIVWERTGSNRSDVAVAASSWRAAESHLSPFVSPKEREFVSSSVDAFRQSNFLDHSGDNCDS